jgi:hypothetical protein
MTARSGAVRAASERVHPRQIDMAGLRLAVVKIGAANDKQSKSHLRADAGQQRR